MRVEVYDFWPRLGGEARLDDRLASDVDDRVGLVGADNQIRILIGVEIDGAGERVAERGQAVAAALDHLAGRGGEEAARRAVVDVDDAASLEAIVGRADRNVAIRVVVDVAELGHTRAEARARSKADQLCAPKCEAATATSTARPLAHKHVHAARVIAAAAAAAVGRLVLVTVHGRADHNITRSIYVI